MRGWDERGRKWRSLRRVFSRKLNIRAGNPERVLARRKLIFRAVPSATMRRTKYFLALGIFMETGVAHSRLSAIDSRRYTRPPRNNALTADRGWKTHVLLPPDDGNEIHETSRVTFLFCMPTLGLSRCAGHYRGVRKREVHANVGDRQRIAGPISF